MRLLPANEHCAEDLKMQQVLAELPVLRKRLTFLLNGYRDLVLSCMSGADPGDTIRSLAKKENEMGHLGIVILETYADWEQVRQEEEKPPLK